VGQVKVIVNAGDAAGEGEGVSKEGKVWSDEQLQ
jgi:hypothetical protein